MDASGRKPWVVRVILIGLLYLVIGLIFGVFTNSSSSDHFHVVIWRLAAWAISGAVYAAHIAYEHFWLANSPRRTSLYTAAAAAVGAFGLAAAANVNGLLVGSSHQRLLMFALVAWPMLAGIPAFLIALLMSGGLSLIRRHN